MWLFYLQCVFLLSVLILASTGQQPFPLESIDMKSFLDFDEERIQSSVPVLVSNIRQWSFVESQLQDPPSDTIELKSLLTPLGHLTSSLEVLANLQIFKHNYLDAIATLERVCPLLDLLPRRPVVTNQENSSCFGLLKSLFFKLADQCQQNPKASLSSIGPGERWSSLTASMLASSTRAAHSRCFRGLRNRSNSQHTSADDSTDDLTQSNVDLSKEQASSGGNDASHVDALNDRDDRSFDNYDLSMELSEDEEDECKRESIVVMTQLLGNVYRWYNCKQIQSVTSGDINIHFNTLRAPYSRVQAGLSTLSHDVPAVNDDDLGTNDSPQADDIDNANDALWTESSVEPYDSDTTPPNNRPIAHVIENDPATSDTMLSVTRDGINEIEMMSSLEASGGIVEDLEVMLLSFLTAVSDDIQLLVIKKVEWYCVQFKIALDLSPKATQKLFREDYVLAQVYVEVLKRILREGYSFIHDELVSTGAPLALLQPDVAINLGPDGRFPLFEGDSHFVMDHWDQLFGHKVDLVTAVDPETERLRCRYLVLATVARSMMRVLIAEFGGVDLPRDGDGILVGLGIFSPDYWLNMQRLEFSLWSSIESQLTADESGQKQLSVDNPRKSRRQNKLSSAKSARLLSPVAVDSEFIAAGAGNIDDGSSGRIDSNVTVMAGSWTLWNSILVGAGICGVVLYIALRSTRKKSTAPSKPGSSKVAGTSATSKKNFIEAKLWSTVIVELLGGAANDSISRSNAEITLGEGVRNQSKGGKDKTSTPFPTNNGGSVTNSKSHEPQSIGKLISRLWAGAIKAVSNPVQVQIDQPSSLSVNQPRLSPSTLVQGSSQLGQTSATPKSTSIQDPQKPVSQGKAAQTSSKSGSQAVASTAAPVPSTAPLAQLKSDIQGGVLRSDDSSTNAPVSTVHLSSRSNLSVPPTVMPLASSVNHVVHNGSLSSTSGSISEVPKSNPKASPNLESQSTDADTPKEVRALPTEESVQSATVAVTTAVQPGKISMPATTPAVAESVSEISQLHSQPGNKKPPKKAKLQGSENNAQLPSREIVSSQTRKSATEDRHEAAKISTATEPSIVVAASVRVGKITKQPTVAAQLAPVESLVDKLTDAKTTAVKKTASNTAEVIASKGKSPVVMAPITETDTKIHPVSDTLTEQRADEIMPINVDVKGDINAESSVKVDTHPSSVQLHSVVVPDKLHSENPMKIDDSGSITPPLFAEQSDRVVDSPDVLSPPPGIFGGLEPRDLTTSGADIFHTTYNSSVSDLPIASVLPTAEATDFLTNGHTQWSQAEDELDNTIDYKSFQFLEPTLYESHVTTHHHLLNDIHSTESILASDDLDLNSLLNSDLLDDFDSFSHSSTQLGPSSLKQPNASMTHPAQSHVASTSHHTTSQRFDSASHSASGIASYLTPMPSDATYSLSGNSVASSGANFASPSGSGLALPSTTPSPSGYAGELSADAPEFSPSFLTKATLLANGRSPQSHGRYNRSSASYDPVIAGYRSSMTGSTLGLGVASSRITERSFPSSEWKSSLSSGVNEFGVSGSITGNHSLPVSIPYKPITASGRSSSGRMSTTAPLGTPPSLSSSPGSSQSLASFSGLPRVSSASGHSSSASLLTNTITTVNVTINIAVRCTVLTSAQTQYVQVASNLLSNWSISQSAVLHRPSLSVNVWIASISFPMTSTGTSQLSGLPNFAPIEYKYLVRSLSGELLAEKGAVHVVDVNALLAAHIGKRRVNPMSLKDIDLLYDVEDIFQDSVKIQD